MSELSRRGVFKTLTAYAVASWVIIEVTSVIAPSFLLPDWVVAAVTTVMVLGAFPVVVLSWTYELSLEGIKRDTRKAPDEVDRSARRISVVLVLFLLTVTTSLWVNYFRAQSVNQLDSLLEAQQGAPEIGTDGLVRSIAVLPFDNFSANPAYLLLADGIAETVLHVLAQNRELVVTSRKSSFAFRDKDITASEIGRILNVQALLEGSVQIAGDRLRVTSQLVRTSDQSHIWSNIYESALDDIFEIQDAIAGEVRELVLPESAARTEPGDALHPPSVEAYQLLLEARQLVGDAELNESAIRLLTVIVGMWPDYADAYAWLAMAWQEQIELLDTSDTAADSEMDAAYEKIRENAGIALELNPDNYLALLIEGQAAPDYTSESYHRALARAFRLAPNDPAVLRWLGEISLYSASFTHAQELWRRARAVEPGDHDLLEGFLYVTCGFEHQGPMVESHLQDYPVPRVKALYLQAISGFCDGDLPASVNSLVRLARISENPKHPLGALVMLASLGHSGALEQLGEAHRLMPASFNRTPLDFVNPSYFPEIVDERLALYERHLKSMFLNKGLLVTYAETLIMAGDYEAAADQLRRAKRFWDRFYEPEGGRFWQSDTMAIYTYWTWLLQQSGERAEAQVYASELLQALDQKQTREWSGSHGLQKDIPLLILLLNGRQDEAVRWLLDAEQDHWPEFQPVLTSPVYGSFRELPQVAASLERMRARRVELLDEILAGGDPEVANPAMLVDLMASLVTPTHHEQAQIALYFDDDLPAALAHYEDALREQPDNIAIIGQAAELLMQYGSLNEAIALYNHIARLAPAEFSAHYDLAVAYAFAERYANALDSVRRALEIEPDAAPAQRWEGMLLLLDGKPEAAMKVFEQIEDPRHRRLGLILGHDSLGARDRSDVLLQETAEGGQIWPFYLACAYAQRGDADTAFEWLRQAAVLGPSVAFAGVHPFLRNLHDDPRWLPFLESIGKQPGQLDGTEFVLPMPGS